jgi:membrane protease YdiL (CAAX protease family)
MTPLDIFLNRHDRLRSGWRFAIFAAAYYALFVALSLTFIVVAAALTHGEPDAASWLISGRVAYLLQFIVEFVPAVVVGWGCGRLFDGVPLRALGWSPHRGWLRDLALGTLFGFATLAVAALASTLFGGYRFTLAPEGFGVAFAKTFFGAALVYVLLAAAEEATFRGYSLQTLMRSLPFLVAVLPSSVVFAYLHHHFNPNVVPGFTFVNTALAGLWLAVAFWRTRSLWFPLGLHWSWNWAMGSVLGLPVSGITSLTRAPLLRATDAGPAWLTGGSYGIEGGAACTFALALATLFIWRTKILRADPDLKRFTDDEMPKKSLSDAGEIII